MKLVIKPWQFRDIIYLFHALSSPEDSKAQFNYSLIHMLMVVRYILATAALGQTASGCLTINALRPTPAGKAENNPMTEMDGVGI